MALPGSYGCRGLIETVDAAVETLPNHDVQFNLGHIEPASVDGSIHKFKTVPKPLGLLGRKSLVERACLVRAQVVHNEDDLLGFFVMSFEISDEPGPIGLGFPFTCLNEPSARQRFARHEHGIDAAPFVLIVVTLQAPPCARDRRTSLLNELSRRFIHTDHGKLRIIRTFIYIEDLLHGGDEITVCFGRNDPSLLLPGFYFVF